MMPPKSASAPLRAISIPMPFAGEITETHTTASMPATINIVLTR